MNKHEGDCQVQAVTTKENTYYWCDTCNEDIQKGDESE